MANFLFCYNDYNVIHILVCETKAEMLQFFRFQNQFNWFFSFRFISLTFEYVITCIVDCVVSIREEMKVHCLILKCSGVQFCSFIMNPFEFNLRL